MYYYLWQLINHLYIIMIINITISVKINMIKLKTDKPRIFLNQMKYLFSNQTLFKGDYATQNNILENIQHRTKLFG